ncbi:hypothetical protein ACFQ0M_18780 [Kitasatospora aburaviensis]
MVEHLPRRAAHDHHADRRRGELLPGSPAPGTPAGAPGDAPAAAQDTAAELADAMTRAIKRIRRRTSERLEPYGITPARAAPCAPSRTHPAASCRTGRCG